MDAEAAERKRQTDIIVRALSDVPMQERELPRFLMLYVTDPSFSRAAISAAEKTIREQRWGKWL